MASGERNDSDEAASGAFSERVWAGRGARVVFGGGDAECMRLARLEPWRGERVSDEVEPGAKNGRSNPSDRGGDVDQVPPLRSSAPQINSPGIHADLLYFSFLSLPCITSTNTFQHFNSEPYAGLVTPQAELTIPSRPAVTTLPASDAPTIDSSIVDKDNLLGPILREQEKDSTIKSQVHTMYSFAAASW